MRKLLIILFCSVVGIAGYAQKLQYQTYKSVMKVSAFKDGENYQWENKNIVAMLDYEFGAFLTKLKNTDFLNPDNQQAVDPESLQDELEYTIKGIFPMRDILNQKSIDQDYVVELQLINDDLLLNRTIKFDVKITRPTQGGAGQYRVFLMRGIMYNYEMQLPGFVGFDNEIEIFIGFNAFWNNP